MHATALVSYTWGTHSVRQLKRHTMSERILFVDDEPRVLQGIQRQLGRNFDLEVADSGAAGLEIVEQQGPFAVVVSDMRMPKMNGIQFLTRVSEIHPDTVRVMLTGYTDFHTVVEAINLGKIFRFINKPCAPDQLAETLNQSLQQYRLVTVERELLSQTLTGSIKALIDIMSLNNPVAFGRASRVRRIVVELGKQLGITDTWELEIASLLSQIGLVAVPEVIWRKANNREWLSTDEAAVLHSHPEVARDLLRNIPRLKTVSEIVFYQNKRFDGGGFPSDRVQGEQIPLGARLLRIALDFESLVSTSDRPDLALVEISERGGHYDPRLVQALEACVGLKSESSHTVRTLSLDEIPDQAIFVEDVATADGEVLMSAGSEMSPAGRLRLRAFLETGLLQDVFQVQVAATRVAPTGADAALA